MSQTPTQEEISNFYPTLVSFCSYNFDINQYNEVVSFAQRLGIEDAQYLPENRLCYQLGEKINALLPLSKSEIGYFYLNYVNYCENEDLSLNNYMKFVASRLGINNELLNPIRLCQELSERFDTLIFSEPLTYQNIDEYYQTYLRFKNEGASDPNLTNEIIYIALRLGIQNPWLISFDQFLVQLHEKFSISLVELAPNPWTKMKNLTQYTDDFCAKNDDYGLNSLQNYAQQEQIPNPKTLKKKQLCSKLKSRQAPQYLSLSAKEPNLESDHEIATKSYYTKDFCSDADPTYGLEGLQALAQLEGESNSNIQSKKQLCNYLSDKYATPSTKIKNPAQRSSYEYFYTKQFCSDSTSDLGLNALKTFAQEENLIPEDELKSADKKVLCPLLTKKYAESKKFNCKPQIFNKIYTPQEIESLNIPKIFQDKYTEIKPTLPENYQKETVDEFCLLELNIHKDISPLKCNFDYMETVPGDERQYIFGPGSILRKENFYECSKFKVLSIPNEPTDDEDSHHEDSHEHGEDSDDEEDLSQFPFWNSTINDIFVYCGAQTRKTLPFGKFKIRFLLPKECFAGGKCLRDYQYSDETPVTSRELCQLLTVFGLNLFKPIPENPSATYDTYFVSFYKSVPKGFKDRYVLIKPT